MAWADVAGAIQSQPGLSSVEIAVAEVIAWIESSGGTQLVGDNGNSYGPFQFNTGGELPAFAAWLGRPMTLSNGQLNPTVTQAAQDPATASSFALGNGGYLIDGIRQGIAQGLNGIPLAIWVEQYIQRPNWSNPAPIIAAITSAWDNLWGQKLPQPSPNPSPPPTGPNPNPTPSPVPSGTYGFDLTLPVIGAQHIDLTGIVNPFVQIGQSLGQLPGTLTNIVVSVERFGWIVLGIAIALVGIWLLVRSEPEEVREVS